MIGGMPALIEALAPGGRLVRTRRLRGGLGARMHALTIERADGSRFKASLRRFVRERPSSEPERVAREFETLRLVEKAGISAPRPLLLDVEGRYFGMPALVQSFLPGRPYWPKTDPGPWAAELARGLRTVHAVTPDRFDLTGLHVQLKEEMRESTRLKLPGLVPGDELMAEVYAVLEAELDRIEWPQPCLVHDDYYPGNTVWLRGKLTGVIDWTDAELGDPRTDVSQCRLDLIVSHGEEAGDAFVEAYQRLAPKPLPDLWFFDLYRGLRALLYYDHWLIGYHDAGLTHLTLEDCGARLRAFVGKVLRERRNL
jgi:aminoglycoside phosphotransferase (APT) family kinase protein